MAEGKSAAPKARRASKVETFSAEERAAMEDHAREVKAASRRSSKPNKDEEEQEVLAKIADMPEADRAIAERLHALIKANAPELSAKTWYGMPAYAKDGQTICYFQNAGKFKARYGTLGFSDKAKLDNGEMWPNAYALRTLGDAEEKQIVALLKRAVG